MNVTMFLMINLCVKVRRSNALMKIKDQVFTGKDNRIVNIIPSGCVVISDCDCE